MRQAEKSRLYLLPGLHVEISATEIREQVADGGIMGAKLLPDAVAEYIREHGLYR